MLRGLEGSSKSDSRTLIVFVHLGSKLPPYLLANVQRMQTLFAAKARTVVVSDLEMNAKICLDLGAEFFAYRRDLGQVWPSSSLDEEFRKGYWRFTSERFAAFAQVHEHYSEMGPAVLCESDVMLMLDFPFSQLASGDCLAWTVAGPGRDVGATVFSPTPSHTMGLANAMAEHIRSHPHLTDMETLFQLRTQVMAQGSVRRLPVWHSGLPQGYYDPADVPYDNDSPYIFDGIFDGAHLGVWLTGGDPRSFWGVIRHFRLSDDNNYVPLGDIRLSYEDGRLYLVHLDLAIPLYTVHVHSKQVSFFNDPDRELSVLAGKSLRGKVIYKFDFRASLDFAGTWIGIYKRAVLRGLARILNSTR